MKRGPKNAIPPATGESAPAMTDEKNRESSLPGTDTFPEAGIANRTTSRKSPSSSKSNGEIIQVAEAMYEESGEVPTIEQIMAAAHCRWSRAAGARFEIDDRIASGNLHRLSALSPSGQAALGMCVARLERSFMEAASAHLEQVRAQDRELIQDAERRCEIALCAAAALKEQCEGLKAQIHSQGAIVDELERDLRQANWALNERRSQFETLKAVADERAEQLARMARFNPADSVKADGLQASATSDTDGSAPSAGSDA